MTSLATIECAVQALAAQRVPTRLIACRLGISAQRVKNIKARLFVNVEREEAEQDRLRSQTKKLGKAVRKAGGHR